MQFDLEGLDIIFPYENIYPEQYEYMLELKNVLETKEKKGHALLEMPTGTGKTVCIFSVYLALLASKPHMGKLIYCTRTIAELNQCMDELKRVINCRRQILGNRYQSVYGLCLSSRRNLCINPKIDVQNADIKCHLRIRCVQQQLPDIEDLYCDYYKNITTSGRSISLPYEVMSIHDLCDYGRKQRICPYYLAREGIVNANIVVFNYQYVLDPHISNYILPYLNNNNNILLFDEGHNIDTILCEDYSICITHKQLKESYSLLTRLTETLQQFQAEQQNQIEQRYLDLQQRFSAADIRKDEEYPPVLASCDNSTLKSLINGPFTRVRSFIPLLKLVVMMMEKWITSKETKGYSMNEMRLEFFQSCVADTELLRMFYSRYKSLIMTFSLFDRSVSFDKFASLTKVVNYCTLVGLFDNGFYTLIQPPFVESGNIQDNVLANQNILKLVCCDAGLVMKPLFHIFKHVIITSGTLSPMDLYPKILQFSPIVSKSICIDHNNHICPVVVSRGNDQGRLTIENAKEIQVPVQPTKSTNRNEVVLSSRYTLRSNTTVAVTYGSLLVDLARIVPDGIICFFTSYSHLELFLCSWDEHGILRDLFNYKLLFIESRDINESDVAVHNYRKACDEGKGAILLCVVRGHISEGVHFNDHYGRCCVIMGIPFLNSLSRELKLKLEYLRNEYDIDEQNYYVYDAIRQCAQCVGRTIRSKTDYAFVVFADNRFDKSDNSGKLPQWIEQQLLSAHHNLTVEMATTTGKLFFKRMAQKTPENMPRVYNKETLPEYIYNRCL